MNPLSEKSTLITFVPDTLFLGVKVTDGSGAFVNSELLVNYVADRSDPSFLLSMVNSAK